VTVGRTGGLPSSGDGDAGDRDGTGGVAQQFFVGGGLDHLCTEDRGGSVPARTSGNGGAVVFQQKKKAWSELTRSQQRTILVGGAAQLALQAAALWDLRRRPDQEVRGSKWWWVAASFVNFLGPVAYFVAARRRRGR
jgi:hypothetical protein